MSLHQDPRTSIFLFRKVIPEPLRPFFGKREFKVSLGTRDPTEAKAKMHGPGAEYERLAQQARIALSEGWSGVARTMVSGWMTHTGRDERWLAMAAARITAWEMVARDHDVAGINPQFAFEYVPAEPGENEALRALSGQHRARLHWPQRLDVLLHITVDRLEWAVEEIIRHADKGSLTKLDVVRNGIAVEFKHRLMTATIRRLPKAHVRQGEQSPTPAPYCIVNNVGTVSMRQPAPVMQSRVGLRLTEAFEAWKNYSPKKKRKPALVQEWDLAVRRFVAMCGDLDMGEITPQAVRNWREKLLEIPSRAKKEIKVLPIAEQVAIAKAQQLNTLAPSTVNKALSGLRAISEHVIEKMAEVPLEWNAAKQAKFVEIEDDEDKRLPFDEDDFTAIFRDLSIDDTTGISRETLFWIILLAPFTGCRLEELGTLRPSNVRREQGILYIAIERDTVQIRAGQEVDEKSFKSANAERDIPVHPLLLRAGFEELVKRRREEGAVWLFPDLTPNKFGKRTARVSRLFARHLEDLGITDDEKVFHSFRHSVRRNLRGRADEEIVDLICGHSDGKTGRRYGRGADMRPLNEVIQLIDFRGPDWNNVADQCRKLCGLPPKTDDDQSMLQFGLAL